MSSHGPRGDVRTADKPPGYYHTLWDHSLADPSGKVSMEGESPDEPPRGVGFTRHREEEKRERWRQALQTVRIEMNQHGAYRLLG